MPKRRTHSNGGGGGLSLAGGGSGGGGSGGGASEIRDVSPAVPVQTYTVQGYSRTRGQMEPLSVTFDQSRRVLVQSSSGQIYEVTTGDRPTCTCPDYESHAEEYERRRGEPYACRHIIAVGNALGISRPEPAVTAYAEPPRTEFAEPPQVAEAAAETPAEPSTFGEHEVSLADDAAFNALLEQARQGPPSYEYENILDNPEATFGVEVEFNGGDTRAIARDLYDAGLIEEPRQRGYHSSHAPGMWSFETDGSVSGGEVVSPVFRDTPEAWRQIETICDVVRRHGGSVSYNCGSHVHIGSARPLDGDSERWDRILRICRENEDLLYRLAAGGDELGGQHRGTNYARPVGNLVSIGRGSRYHAVNRRANTVEFRYFNGTLDPRQIQTNVRLAHGMIQAAARPDTDTRLRGRAMRLGGRVNRDPSRESHTEVRNFLDTIFTRARDKAAVLWLYASSRWQQQINYYRSSAPA